MQAPTKVRAGIIGAALAFFLVSQWISIYPQLVEKYYSNGLYPLLTLFMSGITSQFSFSITEFSIWFGLLIVGPVFLNRLIRRRMTISRALLNVTMVVSVLIAWFYLFWGINYLRVPLNTKLELDEAPLEIDAFDSTFVDIIRQTNQLNLSYTMKKVVEINAALDRSYDHVFDDLGLNKIPGASQYKTLVGNTVLNKTTTSGWFSPFFHEVHYNDDLVIIELPFVLAHEKAHQKGYPNEAEANFLAYLVCLNSEDALIKYSGYFNVIGYFLQSLRADPERREYFVNQLEEGVKLDLIAVKERWKSHAGFISKASNKGYDLYLKANQVNDGKRSYSRVVDLIVKHKARTDSTREKL